MAKLTIEQELHQRKIGKPNFIYNFLGDIWKLMFTKKYGIHAHDLVNLKKKRGPYILVCNHASRLDYMYVGIPLLPSRLNFVAGYNEFFRSHLKGVFKILKVIPKKNFTADVYTIRQIIRVLRKGGKIAIFPEGMSSISGANQPVAIGTGKFIKHCKVPVFSCLIKGGYLTSTKYCLDERPGYVDVTFDQLFTPEEITQLTPEEIEDKINKALYHDDYAWNKIEKHVYKTKGEIAKNLTDLLFICPKCKKEFTMQSMGNTVICQSCHNSIVIDDTYEMHKGSEDSVVPNTQTEWFEMQRQLIKEEVKKPDFILTEEVELGILPEYKPLTNLATSNIVGKGIITLDSSGLTYKGTKNNESFIFHIDTKDLPTYGMCTDLSRFYTFFQGTFYEFYPQNRCVEKWFLATEEMHRLKGGKWQDFKFDKVKLN